MSYFANTDADRQAMLEAIGAVSVEDLFASIPSSLRCQRPLEIPAALPELELTQLAQRLAGRNGHADSLVCFLGGGSYDHFIPAVVDHLASRGEFYTSYTPYQPEVSQGNLQVMFEYQSLVCRLTGMDVSNASLYDGGSAVAEAALMAISTTRRYGKVIVPATLHPEYRQVLATYLDNLETQLVTIPWVDGQTDLARLEAELNDTTACVIVQHPNFFGQLEDVRSIEQLAHRVGAVVVASVDPISLGLLRRPGDWGADIVVAEGQTLGNPLNFGGPYLGILACREQFVRRMPGRIAGQTLDRRGRRCWVLTLQTREQHIRREKATSNICTNQGLFALRATIYLAAMGPRGLRAVAENSLHKAHYAARRITERGRFELAFGGPYFKEFVVRDGRNQVGELLAGAQEDGVLAGIPLGRWYSELGDCFLVAVTEQRSRAEIDQLAHCLHVNAPEIAAAYHA
jgi:glycine dehydrogenase subunit 1